MRIKETLTEFEDYPDLQGESEKAYRRIAKRHPIRERKYWEGELSQLFNSWKFKLKMLFCKSPF